MADYIYPKLFVQKNFGQDKFDKNAQVKTCAKWNKK